MYLIFNILFFLQRVNNFVRNNFVTVEVEEGAAAVLEVVVVA